MLLLEYHNRIIEDMLLEKFAVTDGKYESVEAIIADFDAVTYHLFTDANQKNILFISVSMKCYGELQKYGVDDILSKQYGSLLVSAEQGYDVCLQIDCANPPQDRVGFARNVALLKRHAFAAPFYKAFNDIEQKKGSGALLEIPYRDEEPVYIKPEVDRCIVIFSIQFKDPDDVVLAKLFLQEYADARRTMSNAPSVSYSQKEPPLELRGVRNIKVNDAQGFVSFVLFQPHMSGTKKEKTIDNIMTFRNYLHYHLKCSKAFLHTRMRNRVRTFLQVLNRAKSEPEAKEKKTIT